MMKRKGEVRGSESWNLFDVFFTGSLAWRCCFVLFLFAKWKVYFQNFRFLFLVLIGKMIYG